MRKRLVLVCASLLGALLLVPAASAYYGPNPINDPSSRTALVGLLDTRGDALELLIDPSLTTDQQKELRGRIIRAKSATGRLPAFGTAFARLAIGTSAVALGYQIAHDTGVGEYIAGWITGYTEPATSGIAVLQKLEVFSDPGADAYGCNYGAFFAHDYYYPYGTLSGGPSFPYAFSDTGGGPEAIYNALLGWAASADYSVVNKLANDASLPQTSCTTNIYSVNPAFHFFGVPLQELEEGFRADVFEDAGTTPDETIGSGAWAESTGDPGETAEITAARAALEGDTADDTDPVAVAAGQLIDPAWEGYVSTEPQLLPQPLPNETYTDYIARLVTEGWVGTITDVEVSPVQEGYGPESPVRVEVTTPSGVTILDPIAWPTGGVEFVPDTDTTITVRWNPDTAIPVPNVAAGDCNCPPIDFGPITELDYGLNFPFGFFTWMGDTWTDMTGGVAECLVGDIDSPVFGTIDIEFCSEIWEEDWRDRAFLIAQFIMTMSVIVYFSLKFLGLRSGPDDD